MCRDPRGLAEAIKNKISGVIKRNGVCGTAYIFNVSLNKIRRLVGVLFLFVHILAASGREKASFVKCRNRLHQQEMA